MSDTMTMFSIGFIVGATVGQITLAIALCWVGFCNMPPKKDDWS
jgi:hypothetical protein